MAKTDKEQPIFQALGVDDFGSTRPDDFDGAIKGARYIAFKWPNSQYGHALYAEITFLPDPDSGFEEFSEVYKVGSLKFNFPSLDGKTLAGPEDISVDDYETLADDPEAFIPEGEEELYKGPFVLTIVKDRDKKTDRKLPNSHWSQFMKAVKDLYPPDDPEADPDGTSFPTQLNIDAMLAGYRFHFLRVDEDNTKRKKKDNGKGPFQILVPTDALGKDDSLAADDGDSKKSSKAKPAPAAAKKNKPKPEPEEDEDEDTETDLEDLDDTEADADEEDAEESDESRYINMIRGILGSAKKGEGMTTQAIIARFVGTAKTPSDKSAGMKLIQTPKWMQAADRPWKLKEGKYYPK
jgi:hypothetical protein